MSESKYGDPLYDMTFGQFVNIMFEAGKAAERMCQTDSKHIGVGNLNLDNTLLYQKRLNLIEEMLIKTILPRIRQHIDVTLPGKGSTYRRG